MLNTLRPFTVSTEPSGHSKPYNMASCFAATVNCGSLQHAGFAYLRASALGSPHATWADEENAVADHVSSSKVPFWVLI